MGYLFELYIGFNCERIKGSVGRSRGLTFLVWDVGGQEKIRPLWRSYTRYHRTPFLLVEELHQET